MLGDWVNQTGSKVMGEDSLNKPEASAQYSYGEVLAELLDASCSARCHGNDALATRIGHELAPAI